MKFYYCPPCHETVVALSGASLPLSCSGIEMVELIPNTAEATREKHTPVVVLHDHTVTVTTGSNEHPMTDEHYIEWIALETEEGIQIKRLRPNMPPTAVFAMAEGDRYRAAYSFCNLHSLWQSE